MSSEKVISEATPIRVGLVILFLGVFAGGVWWAASVQSKLDSLISLQASMTVNTTTLIKDLTDLKTKQATDAERTAVEIVTIKADLKKIRDEGSPITDKRLTLIERALLEKKP